jgi:hypothetical protein
MPTEHDDRLWRDRLENAERDLRDHSKSITALTEDQHSTNLALIAIDKATAVRAKADENLDERLDRIEERLKGVYSLGLWLLAAAGTALVGIVVEFVANGGLHHVP